MSLRQASLLQGLRCATKNGKYDFTRSNGYLGLYPIWLRRPRDTKVKWGISQHSRLTPEKLTRTDFRYS